MALFRISPRILLVWVSILGIFSSGHPVLAQDQPVDREYTLGRGDVLQLSVWQQPELDRELRVRADGSIVVPLVGEVEALGSTIEALEAEVARRLRAFNRDITEVSLTVVAFNSLEIFVMGAVQNPGSYTFDRPPTAWDALRAAGGPLRTANLRRTRILRQGDDGTTRTLTVNLDGLVSGRAPRDGVAPLFSGDTIVVPDLEGSATYDREQGVRVMGRVADPGFYPIDESTPLLTVIVRAGGFRDGADLEAVRLVHLDEDGAEHARMINVRDYLDRGRPEANPMVHAGDTVFVDAQPSRLSLLGLLSATTGIATIVLNFFLFQ